METQNNNNEDLLKKLADQAETKTAGTGAAPLGNDFFDETANPKKPEEETPESETKETPGNKEETKGEEESATIPSKKLSKDVKEASARTAVGMLDFSQKLIFVPLLSWKFKKRFTPEEVKRLDAGVEDAKKEDLNDEDYKLRSKWDRLLKKHLKKIEAVPLEETEKADLEKAFYMYMDVKNKELPPEYFLGLTIITSIGKRAIDVITD